MLVINEVIYDQEYIPITEEINQAIVLLLRQFPETTLIEPEGNDFFVFCNPDNKYFIQITPYFINIMNDETREVLVYVIVSGELVYSEEASLKMKKLIEFNNELRDMSEDFIQGLGE